MERRNPLTTDRSFRRRGLVPQAENPWLAMPPGIEENAWGRGEREVSKKNFILKLPSKIGLGSI